MPGYFIGWFAGLILFIALFLLTGLNLPTASTPGWTERKALAVYWVAAACFAFGGAGIGWLLA